MLFLNYIKENQDINYLGMFFQIVFIVFVFLIVIFLAYFSTKFIGNTRMRAMKSNNMQIIETISIGFNNLHILKINEKFYLISSSKEGIKYLTELEKNCISFDYIKNDFSFEENLKKFFKKNKE